MLNAEATTTHNMADAHEPVKLVRWKPDPRAKLEQDWEGTIEAIRIYGSCWLTLREIAAKLRVSRVTLWKFMAKYPEAAEAYDMGLAEGDGDLRIAQKRSAVEKLDPTMLKWMGTHRLGQKDKTERDVNVKVVTLNDYLDSLPSK